MRKIKLFTDLEILKNVPKGYIFPLIDYLYQDSQNMSGYYQITNTILECDIAVLPVAVDFLLNNKRHKYVTDFIKNAENANKKVLNFTSGDFGATLNNDNIVTVRLAGFKTKFKNKTFIMPPFINDPYAFLNKKVDYLGKESIPKVGFVGHSATGIVKLAKEFLIFVNGFLKRIAKKEHTDYQFFYPSSFFRFKYLNILKKSPEISCDFILRNQYRAGVKTEADKHKTSLEFFQNIHDNPYTFCMRGGGNFSVRFYETLAMGRIPILIDTDCQLPFSENIDWNKHCLIISEKEVKNLPEKLLDFHSDLTPERFLALQKENRLLWEEYFTKETFFKQLAEELKNLIK